MISLSVIDMMALLCIVFIGLPHGAFDGALYALLPSGERKASLLRFLALYSLTALLIIGLWLVFPMISLLLFLAISAFHFGKGDTAGYQGKNRFIALIAHGGLVTMYLPFIHHKDAMAFFSYLTFRPADELGLLAAILTLAAILWSACVLYYGYLAVTDRRYRRRFSEIILAAILMAYLPLLPAFAFYFCALHSARHFTSIYQALKTQAPRRLWPLAISLSVASWLAGGLTLLALLPYQDMVLSMIQILFIGLAALTVPHMILVDGLWRPLFLANRKTDHG